MAAFMTCATAFAQQSSFSIYLKIQADGHEDVIQTNRVLDWKSGLKMKGGTFGYEFAVAPQSEETDNPRLIVSVFPDSQFASEPLWRHAIPFEPNTPSELQIESDDLNVEIAFFLASGN